MIDGVPLPVLRALGRVRRFAVSPVIAARFHLPWGDLYGCRDPRGRRYSLSPDLARSPGSLPRQPHYLYSGGGLHTPHLPCQRPRVELSGASCPGIPTRGGGESWTDLESCISRPCPTRPRGRSCSAGVLLPAGERGKHWALWGPWPRAPPSALRQTACGPSADRSGASNWRQIPALVVRSSHGEIARAGLVVAGARRAKDADQQHESPLINRLLLGTKNPMDKGV